jgi:hypothetical protein
MQDSDSRLRSGLFSERLSIQSRGCLIQKTFRADDRAQRGRSTKPSTAPVFIGAL